MIVIFSLDAVLLLMAALMFIGIGWVTMLAAWVWQHALIVGIILLILYLIQTFAFAVITRKDYGVLGSICTVAHAILPPFVVIEAYKASIATGESFGLSMLINFMLVFWGLGVSEMLFSRTLVERKNTSLLCVVFFTVLSIAVSALLLRLVIVEGF